MHLCTKPTNHAATVSYINEGIIAEALLVSNTNVITNNVIDVICIPPMGENETWQTHTPKSIFISFWQCEAGKI